MKDRYQTSFVIDKELWIKFKSKTLREGSSIKKVLHELISDYVKGEKINGRSWFHLPKWR
jgi:hypothetical protein